MPGNHEWTLDGRAAIKKLPLLHRMEERAGERRDVREDAPLLGPLPTPASWGEEEKASSRIGLIERRLKFIIDDGQAINRRRLTAQHQFAQRNGQRARGANGVEFRRSEIAFRSH